MAARCAELLRERNVIAAEQVIGQVEEGDRVIQILNEAKQTRRLVTQVLDGNLCASMCIPIFLQGDDRLAARASNWIFHEATRPGAAPRWWARSCCSALSPQPAAPHVA